MKLKIKIYSTILSMLFIGIFSAVFMDLTMNLYNLIKGLRINDFQLLGRYILYTLQGHLIENRIETVPYRQHEIAIGWIAHFTISFIYSLFYVLIIEKGLAVIPSFKKAIFFSWALLIFPLGFMSYAFGYGLFWEYLPDTYWDLFFSFLCHTCYGIGIYVSALILYHVKLELTK